MLVVVFGLAFTGCPTDSDSDGGGVPSTSGRLTITWPDAKYDGNFAAAMISDDAVKGYGEKATSETTMEAVPISDGQVALPVYKYAGSKLESYSGTETVLLYILILSSKVVSLGKR
jgi:hypothetical protein